MKRKLWRVLLLAVLALLLVPAVALAVSPSPTLIFTGKQLWVMLLGSLVPLATYVLNHYAPWVREPAKAIVLIVVAAVVGGIYTAIATNNFGFNTATLEQILSAVVAALVAHKILWLPSGISILLGGGSNIQSRRARVSPAVRP